MARKSKSKWPWIIGLGAVGMGVVIYLTRRNRPLEVIEGAAVDTQGILDLTVETPDKYEAALASLSQIITNMGDTSNIVAAQMK